MMPSCFYCGEPAPLFCDFKDCDRPICTAHAKRIGQVCYRSKNKRMSDSIDHCKSHDEVNGDKDSDSRRAALR